MSAFGERISAKTNQSTVRVEVAAWGDENEPMVLFAAPLSAGEFSKLQRKHPDFLANMTIEGLVDLIIMKAMDESGNKAFDVGDKPILMRQPVNVISDVAGQLMGDMNSVEDAKKD
jgi:hypothetical protein